PRCRTPTRQCSDAVPTLWPAPEDARSRGHTLRRDPDGRRSLAPRRTAEWPRGGRRLPAPTVAGGGPGGGAGASRAGALSTWRAGATEAPTKQTTTGFPHAPAAATTREATSAAGGLL